MENVLLAISLLSCIALIVAVLLQRSEGGALGMGGGGAGGGLVSSRGAADTLVRVTMILAAVFFCTSLALTRINAEHSKDVSDVSRTLSETTSSQLDEADDVVPQQTSAPESSDLISDVLSDEPDDISTSNDTEALASEGANANSAPDEESSQSSTENN